MPEFETQPFPHPQGCRGYLVVDPASKEALVLDPHLDAVEQIGWSVKEGGYQVRWVVDSHTHADHPSGSAPLAAALRASRVAHPLAGHAGATHLPEDNDRLELGDDGLLVRYAPGHTPDHLVLLGGGQLFSGDTLLIGGVARTDFLGGDAGILFDSIHDVMLTLPDATRLWPGHDYQDRMDSTIGQERATNPWLAIRDRDRFVERLTANPPPEPANMPALLRLNRDEKPIPPGIEAAEVAAIVREGGAGSVIDVRTDPEVKNAHVPGSRHILLDTIPQRLDEILLTPAPRLLLCHVGERAEMARRFLESRGVAACQTIRGGIDAYVRAGGEVVGGAPGAVLDGGGACAASAPEA